MDTTLLPSQTLRDATKEQEISYTRFSVKDGPEAPKSNDAPERSLVVRFADIVDSADDTSSGFSDISECEPPCDDAVSDSETCQRRRTSRLCTEGEMDTACLDTPAVYEGVAVDRDTWALDAGVKLAYGVLAKREETKQEKGRTGVEQLGDAFGVCCLKGLKSDGWNQDDYFVYDAPDRTFIGVFDGHGSYGHDASAMARHYMIQRILQDRNEATQIENVLHAAFAESNVELLKTPRLESSGTTASVLCVDHVHRSLVCAHVGDSRIVALPGAHELTQDHRPEDKEELVRIKAAGGEVRTSSGDISSRVFKAGENRPGLAMSRSLGDRLGKMVGVCADPTISRHALTHTRLIICSDGVSEFLSTAAASGLVAPKTSAQDAAQCLAHAAWDCWIKEERGLLVDDITVIVYDVPAARHDL